MPAAHFRSGISRFSYNAITPSGDSIAVPSTEPLRITAMYSIAPLEISGAPVSPCLS